MNDIIREMRNMTERPLTKKQEDLANTIKSYQLMMENPTEIHSTKEQHDISIMATAYQFILGMKRREIGELLKDFIIGNIGDDVETVRKYGNTKFSFTRNTGGDDVTVTVKLLSSGRAKGPKTVILDKHGVDVFGGVLSTIYRRPIHEMD